MAIWYNFTNQKQWKEYLKHLIRTNKKALLKSIVVIYDNQTLEEKEAGVSIYENKIGFNRFDAEEMMNIARKIKQNIQLKQNEIVHARIVMPKYWKQLMVISKKKQKEKKEQEEFECELIKMQIMVQEKQELLNEIAESVCLCINEGIPCNYGICDECPNTLGNIRSDDNV